MYLATQIRPDIAYTVEVLARFNSNPGEAHWKAVKHLFHYIKGMLNYYITYLKSLSFPYLFITYSDADHGGCPDTDYWPPSLISQGKLFRYSEFNSPTGTLQAPLVANWHCEHQDAMNRFIVLDIVINIMYSLFSIV
jgi:hypothetical protein